MDVEEMYETLVDYGFATREEIALVCAINGFNKETLVDILFIRTGLRDFESCLDY